MKTINSIIDETPEIKEMLDHAGTKAMKGKPGVFIAQIVRVYPGKCRIAGYFVPHKKSKSLIRFVHRVLKLKALRK